MENDIASFTSLYKAYKKAKKNKRCTNSVLKYEMQVIENTARLCDELKNRTYRPSPTYTFRVYEPKERVVEANAFVDKVVQHSLCDNALVPYFSSSFIRDNYASQVGKGTQDALDRLQFFMRKYYFQRKAESDKHSRENGLAYVPLGKGGYENGWVLKGDFAHYFYSIQHWPLKMKAHEKIVQRAPDAETRDFCCWLLDLFIDSTEGVGIPIGFQTSQPLAILNLDEMDHYVKEELGAKMYGRYMDDFYIIHESKEQLKEWLADIQNLIKPLGLRLNNKTQIFPLTQGLDFLGYHTYLASTGKVVRKIRNTKKSSLRRKLKKFRKKLDAGAITIPEIVQSYESTKSHMEHGNTYRVLRDMDDFFYKLFPEIPRGKGTKDGKKNNGTRRRQQS